MWLALRLGRTLTEVYAMPSWELPFWAAYFEADIDQEREDWRMGQVCATIANCLSKGRWKASDFMPRKRRRTSTDQEILAYFKALEKIGER